MINHKHKFIFLHIPKSGGLSLVDALSRKTEVEEKFKSGHPRYENYIDFFGEEVSTYYSFTFVRNPWDRFVSAFHYLKKGGRNNCLHDINAGKALKNYNFSSFAKDFTFQKFNFVHFAEQLFFIGQPNQLNFIGRFENLQQDFNTVCDKIGIPRQQLSHMNKSKHKHYSEYYDDETREIVAEKYARDIEYFGYKFGE
jgi:hypothetical protein